MPWLVMINALTTCQVFYANAEVSAGRFGFLWWFVPLHAIYLGALHAVNACGMLTSMTMMVVFFGAISACRFVFSVAGTVRR
jgi:hypothetical protein